MVAIHYEMIEADTLDMIICRPEGEISCSAWYYRGNKKPQRNGEYETTEVTHAQRNAVAKLVVGEYDLTNNLPYTLGYEKFRLRSFAIGNLLSLVCLLSINLTNC